MGDLGELGTEGLSELRTGDLAPLEVRAEVLLALRLGTDCLLADGPRTEGRAEDFLSCSGDIRIIFGCTYAFFDFGIALEDLFELVRLVALDEVVLVDLVRLGDGDFMGRVLSLEVRDGGEDLLLLSLACLQS